MPAIGTAIDTAVHTGFSTRPSNAEYIFTFSDGWKMYIYHNGTHAVYRMQNLSGGWSAAVALAWDWTAGDNTFAAVKDPNADVVMIVGATSTSTFTFNATRYTWNATAHTMSVGTTYTVNISSLWASGTGITSIAATAVVYSGQTVCVVAMRMTGVGLAVTSFLFPPGLLGISLVSSQAAVNGSGGVTIAPYVAGSVTYIVGYTNTPSIILYKVTVTDTGGDFTVAASEAPTTVAATGTLNCLYDVTGKLDIFFTDGTNLKTIKRTGTGSYGAVATLAASVTTGSYFAATAQAAGDAWVFYQTTVGQANGEIYVAKRSGGTWAAGTLYVGGDASGYTRPNVSRAVSAGGAFDFGYEYGAANPWTQYWAAGVFGATPNTPTGVTPSGSIGTLTPTVAWPYVNPNGSADPQGAYEVLVKRVSDGVTMWDTGIVASAAGSVVYAGTALVYGIQYQVQVRVRDSINSAWSAYSAAVTFTPYHLPVTTLTSITNTDASVYSASPATIKGQTFTIADSYAQVDGHAASRLTVQLYDATGVTLLGTAIKTESPLLAAGGSETYVWPTGVSGQSILANATSYTLAIFHTDNVSGATSTPVLWTITTAFIPPGVPTGMIATANQAEGRIDARWTNAAGTVTNNVYWRTSAGGGNPAGPWILAAGGTLRTAISIWTIPLRTAIDIGVSSVSSAGVEGSLAIVSNLYIELLGGVMGIWLHNADNPAQRVALGMGTDFPSMTGFDHVLEVITWVPEGATDPIRLRKKTNTYRASGRRYTLAATDMYTNLTWQQVLAQLTPLYETGAQLLYRDVDGTMRFVVMEQFHRETATAIDKDVSFNLEPVRRTNQVVIL